MDPAHLEHEATGTPRQKTTLKTFRFPGELSLALEKEAEEHGISLNAQVSSILTQHTEWDAKAAKFGFIPIYKPTFIALLDEMSDDALRKIGRTIHLTMWKEMAEFFLAGSSGEALLDFLARPKPFPVVQTEVKRQGREYMAVFHHDLGPKWSVVLSSALDEFVRSSFHAQPTISAGDTVVTAQFVAQQANSPT